MNFINDFPPNSFKVARKTLKKDQFISVYFVVTHQVSLDTFGYMCPPMKTDHNLLTTD